MKIRKAVKQDAKALNNIHKTSIIQSCFDYSYQQILAWTQGDHTGFEKLIETSQNIYVIEDEDKVVGFFSLKNGDYLRHLYVHADYQRKGFGTKMLDNAEKITKKNKHQKIWLDANVNSLDFYLNKGYELTKVHEIEMNEEKLMVCQMEKSL